MKANLIIIDLETACDIDLSKVGLRRYINHESFELIMIAYTIVQGDQWDNKVECSYLRSCHIPHNEKFPDVFTEPPSDHNTYIVAHNKVFEINVLKRFQRQYNIHEYYVDPNNYIDTMEIASFLNLPNSLSELSSYMYPRHSENFKFENTHILKKYLIKRNKEYRDHLNTCELEELRKYNIQDVNLTRTILKDFYMLFKKYNSIKEAWSFEKKVANTTYHVNNYGVSIDNRLFDTLFFYIKDIGEKIKKNIENKYGMNLLSNKQMLKLIEDEFGIKYPKSDQETMNTIIDDLERDFIKPRTMKKQEILNLLNLRMILNFKVGKKLLTAKDQIYNDKLYDLLIYNGAVTGRWASRGFQIQNIKNNGVQQKDLSVKIKQLYENKEQFNRSLNESMENNMLMMDHIKIANELTPSIIVPKKEELRLIASDYSQIELRLMYWIAGDTEKLKYLCEGKDFYKYFASKYIYQIPEKEITKKQRHLAKQIVLSCQYGQGARTFRAYCKSNGISLTLEGAQKLVTIYRKSHSLVTKYWYMINNTLQNICDAVDKEKPFGHNYNIPNTEYKIRFDLIQWLGKKNLFITYPSKSIMVLNNLRIKSADDDKKMLVYGNNNEYLYGTKLAQYIVQKYARDVLSYAFVEMRLHGIPMLFTVHDEILFECNDSPQVKEIIENTMKNIPFCPFDLNIESRVMERFFK